MASLLSISAKFLLIAQVSHASVTGVVRDATTGAPLPGAIVTLPDLDRVTETDQNGQYHFPEVPPGPQHLSVQNLGHEGRTLHALVPRAGELEVNIFLRPDPIPVEGVEVRTRVPLRGTEPTDSTRYPDRGMSMASVRTHPLLAEPDVLQAMGGGEVVVSPESPRGIHVRGGASDQTGYLLDGIPVFSPYHAGGLFSAWNPDALARLDLSSTAPSPAYPDALSGTVLVTTRTPGSRLRGQGALSTSSARVTLDGPMGRSGAGFLLSYRGAFPGGVFVPDEPSYLRGEASDWMAKAETPALGGELRLLAYETLNEMDATSASGAPDPPIDPRPARNSFRWDSRSMGGSWIRQLMWGELRVRGWCSSGNAGAVWNLEGEPPARMVSKRRDGGILLEAAKKTSRGWVLGGIRAEQSRTSYRTRAEGIEASGTELVARTPILAAFIQRVGALGAGVELNLGTTFTLARGRMRAGPRAQLRWDASQTVSLTASLARFHQYAQSLRNSESVAGNIFPVDLFLGSGRAGVPVARSDQGVLTAAFAPFPGLRVGAQVYLKSSDNLLLVAPTEGGPFSVGGFAVGSGSSRGFAAEGVFSHRRFGILATYGWQRVRLTHGDDRFTPEWGSAHTAEAGVIVFPTLNSSFRLGAVGAFGRRTTAVSGILEWEACNLLDRGCEFGGSPDIGGEVLGGTVLPAYLRLDLTLQNHWHVTVAGRDAVLSLFGTLTNLLGRKNLLTFATDPATGERTGIEMRPLAPLVLGLDWRF